jgi:hypothetical protein
MLLSVALSGSGVVAIAVQTKRPFHQPYRITPAEDKSKKW